MAEDDIALGDMPIEERRKLAYNDPLLDAHAEQVSQDIGIPGIVTALKNAGEKSGTTAVSPKGAQGVMQFMPGTAQRFGLTDPTDPYAAITAAGQYVKHIAKTIGSKDPALIAAAYNAGEHRKDILAGKIPLIPETQKYAQRVKGYFASKDAPEEIDPADIPDGVDAEDIPKEAVKDVVSPRGPQVNSTPSDASPIRQVFNPFGKNWEYRVPQPVANFLAAVDRGVTDPVIGASQRVRELVNRGGKAIGMSQPLFDLSQSYRDTKNVEKYDQPLLHSGLGMAGYMTGAGIDTALTGGAGASSLPAAAAYGALSGYTMPTASEGEALTNAGVGGVLGPVTTLIGRGVGKLAEPVLDKIRPVIDSIHIPGVVKPSIGGTMTGPQRAAVEEALKADVPVWERQLTKPGYALVNSQREAQRAGFDKAISKTVGQNTDDLQSAWMAAKEHLSSQYNDLLDNKVIPLDVQHIADLGRLAGLNQARSPRFAPNEDVTQAIKGAWDAAHQNPQLSGREYQQALREYNALAGRLFRGTATNPSDPYSARIVADLASSLEDQAAKVLNPKEMAQFKRLNSQWRNLSQLEAVVPKNLEGSVDPRQLANRLASLRKDEFLYGKGDQSLPNLAKFGATYMDLNHAPKHGFWADAKRGAAKVAPFIVGSAGEGLVAGSMMGANDVDPFHEVGKMGLGALAVGVPWTLYRRGAAGPRMTLQSLNAPRGGLGLTARGAVSPGALTRFLEAEHDRGDQ